MKSVLITGASRGIGAAAARLFSENGYAVAVNYHRSQEAAEQLVRELVKAGGEAFTVQADVADETQVLRMAQTVTQRIGDPDVVIHNAGIALEKLLTDVTSEEWHRMIGVHLDGAYHCCRAFVPAMVRRHTGNILLVSSIWGVTGGSCEVPYSAAKAGLIGFTKALARELGPSGIRVNAVTPGVIDTDMCRGYSEKTRQELAEETPLMRLGTAEDVANALMFLASEQAAFITGQVLGVDGGILI